MSLLAKNKFSIENMQNHIHDGLKDDLYNLYIVDGMSILGIADLYDTDYAMIYVLLWHYHIKIKQYGCKMDDAFRWQIHTLPKSTLYDLHINKKIDIGDIADMYESYIDKKTIIRLLNYYDIPVGSKIKLDKPSIDELIDLYIINKVSMKEIANKYDVIPTTVGEWLKDKKIDNGVRSRILKILLILDYKKYGSLSVRQKLWYTYEYQQWRRKVFKRDKYTCQMCSRSNIIMNAHHIIPFADHPELVCDVGNGITLCERCHKSIRGREYDYVHQFSAVTKLHS